MHVFRRPPDYAVKHSASLSPAQLKLANVWRAPWVNKGPGFLVDDIVMTQRTDFSVSGDPVTVYRAHGEVVSVGIDAVTGDEYADILVEEGAEYFDANEDLEWVAVGNKSTPERAAIIYMTADEVYAPRIEMRSGVDSWSKFGSMESLRVAIGNLSGIVDSNFGSLSGYGIFTDNAYFKGGIALGSATSMTAGAGLWATKEGDFRVGDYAAGKYFSFTVGTGIFNLGSSVALQWNAVTGSGKPADNATVGANWTSNLAGIPIRFADAPTGAGLYVTSSYLGYYNASTWTAYINNAGQWYFAGDASNYVQWNGTAVTLRGNVIMEGGSISWASVTAPDYSQIGGTKPPSNADNTTTVIGANRLTYIDGSGIYTGTLTTAQLNAGAATVLGAVTAGSFNIGSGAFQVTSAGLLTATGVNISGAITATSGSFTGAVYASSGTFTGTVSGSTITASTLTTAASGARVVVGAGSGVGWIDFYDAGGRVGGFQANSGTVYCDVELYANGNLHTNASFQGPYNSDITFKSLRPGSAWTTITLPASNDSTIWTSANDGSGTGLDADLLDGQHASAFAAAGHTHSSLTGNYTGSIDTGGAPIIQVSNGVITGVV